MERVEVQLAIGALPEVLVHLAADLLPQVEVFYQPATPDSQRRDLLRRYGVRYVFWGPDERMLGDWDPGQSPSLSLFHKDGDYAVYQVNDTP